MEIKVSKILRVLGTIGIVFSGALNALFLYASFSYQSVAEPIHNLPPYHLITKQDIKYVQLPKNALPSQYFQGDLIGRTTSTEVPMNQPVQSFEIANQQSYAQVISDLYKSNPNLSFTQISILSNALNETIQPNQYVTLVANGITYPHILVLSVSNTSGSLSSGVSQDISNAITNFVSNPSTSTTTSSSQQLYALVGAPWATIQSLMNTQNIQVVLGNTGQGASAATSTSNYTLGSPSINAVNNSSSVVQKNTTNPNVFKISSKKK